MMRKIKLGENFVLIDRGPSFFNNVYIGKISPIRFVRRIRDGYCHIDDNNWVLAAWVKKSYLSRYE